MATRQSSIFSKILMLGLGMFLLTFLSLESYSSSGSNHYSKLGYFQSLNPYQYFNHSPSHFRSNSVDKVHAHILPDVPMDAGSKNWHGHVGNAPTNNLSTSASFGGEVRNSKENTGTPLSKLSLLFEQAEIMTRQSSDTAVPRNHGSLVTQKNSVNAELPPDSPVDPQTHSPCSTHFEDACRIYPYVKFWKKSFNARDCHQSPLRRKRADRVEIRKYVVFQPDMGGWNNIRMAAETVMVFAMATGRTLVLPPEISFYLLNKNPHGDNKSIFQKYFDLNKIAEIVDMISMKDFVKILKQEGKLNVSVDVENFARDHRHLWQYLENTCYTRDYHPGRMFFGFNITASGLFGTFERGPRMKKHAAHDRELVPYDSKLDENYCIYFPGDYRETSRVLTHFYSYLYWENPLEEHLFKRIVRDRLHYRKVVRLLHQDSAALRDSLRSDPCRGGFFIRHGHNHSGVGVAPRMYITCHDKVTLGGSVRHGPTYFAVHIRRGDFQYTHTRLSSQQLWSNVQHLLNSSISPILYIATDEKNRTFFDPFSERFQLRFLEDYVESARLRKGEFNQNLLGMVEQVICANAHTFVGTPLSTFTGYITRMRGYYRDGRYANTFYSLPDPMYQLHKFPELKGPFWAREFAVAHRDIDDDAGQSSLSHPIEI